MILQKWDFETHKYEEHYMPDGCNVVLYTADMEAMVDCVNCLRPLTFGETLTSKTIHTDMGLGYPVCSQCHEEECADEYKHKARRNIP